MRVQLCVLAVMCGVAGISASAMPPFFTACSASDPGLDSCIEGVIRAGGRRFTQGIPELGIATLDPVHLGTVHVDNPALKLTFYDTVVTGLGGFRINAFRMYNSEGRATLDFTSNVTLKADYDMEGQLLILPIRGKGQAKIKITNLNIIVKYQYSTHDGHWRVDSYRDSYKMDRAQFKFTNLFNGNKQLSDLTSRFVNENWRVIMSEVAPPAINEITRRCVKEVEKLFTAVPSSELLRP
ncbi:circadian clock-controlled protein daywake-like isoform X1 [Plutella xylostella]|uniref:circadian clock-controlled protein daywake-like isoform X1 n=1 Tax=Plutella xylostella TaxID=51655 RepID=UPI002032BA0A|nr:circadian clock-controlled protein daywake-like isoform X1 [Plutella xylostella]